MASTQTCYSKANGAARGGKAGGTGTRGRGAGSARKGHLAATRPPPSPQHVALPTETWSP